MAGSETAPLGSPSSFGNTIFSTTTLAASASGAKLPGVEKYTSALFQLGVGTVTGTSPTLDVFIQTLLPDGSTWQDILAFTQVTSSTSSQKGWFVSGAASVAVVKTEALAAATAEPIGLGNYIRVRCKVGGTNPSFGNVVVYANFYE